MKRVTLLPLQTTIDVVSEGRSFSFISLHATAVIVL